MVFYEKRAGKCGKELKMSLIKGIHHVCLKCANEAEYKEVVHF